MFLVFPVSEKQFFLWSVADNLWFSPDQYMRPGGGGRWGASACLLSWEIPPSSIPGCNPCSLLSALQLCATKRGEGREIKSIIIENCSQWPHTHTPPPPPPSHHSSLIIIIIYICDGEEIESMIIKNYSKWPHPILSQYYSLLHLLSTAIHHWPAICEKDATKKLFYILILTRSFSKAAPTCHPLILLSKEAAVQKYLPSVRR